MPSTGPAGAAWRRRGRLGRAGRAARPAARRAPGSRPRAANSGSSSPSRVRQLRDPDVPVDDALGRCRRRPQALDAALEIRDRALLLERGGGGHGGGHPVRSSCPGTSSPAARRSSVRGPPATLAAGPRADRVGAQQDDRLDGALLGQAQRLLGRRAAQAGGQAADARSPRAGVRRTPAPSSWAACASTAATGSDIRPRPDDHRAPVAQRRRQLAAGLRRRRAARCAPCPGAVESAPRRGQLQPGAAGADRDQLARRAAAAWRIRSSITGARCGEVDVADDDDPRRPRRCRRSGPCRARATPSRRRPRGRRPTGRRRSASRWRRAQTWASSLVCSPEARIATEPGPNFSTVARSRSATCSRAIGRARPARARVRRGSAHR